MAQDNLSNLNQTYNQTGGTSGTLKVNAWSIQNNRNYTPNFNGGMTITLGGANTANEHVGLISPTVKNQRSSLVNPWARDQKPFGGHRATVRSDPMRRLK